MESEKKLSGAQNRKRKKEIDELVEERFKTDKLSGHTAASVAMFSDLGAPPDTAIGTIAYANRAAGLLLHSVLTDDNIDESQRRRLAKDFIAVIGMTHSKALYEERLKSLEKKVGLSEQKPNHVAEREAFPSSGGPSLRVRGATRELDSLHGSEPCVQAEEDE